MTKTEIDLELDEISQQLEECGKVDILKLEHIFERFKYVAEQLINTDEEKFATLKSPVSIVEKRIKIINFNPSNIKAKQEHIPNSITQLKIAIKEAKILTKT